MWWAKSDSFAQAWLGCGRVMWSAAVHPATLRAVQSTDEALEELNRSASADPSRAIRVWLGGDLCKLVCVPAITGVRQPRDAQAAATAWLRAEGQLLSGWAVHLAECHRAATWWRAALAPDDLVKRINAACMGRVRSIRPWWSWALQQRRPRTLALHAYDGGALVTSHWDDSGGFAGAETIAPVEDLAAARRVLRRRALQAVSTVPTCVWIDWTTGGAIDGNGSGFALAPWLRWGDEL